MAKRITLKCGRKTKSYILTSGPVPRTGETVQMLGADWAVVGVKDVEVAAEFSTKGGKLVEVRREQLGLEHTC